VGKRTSGCGVWVGWMDGPWLGLMMDDCVLPVDL